MPRYERFALVLDSEASVLGQAAMRLLELGVDVLYAKDADEAALLAEQEAQRLGAVMAPTSFDAQTFDQLLARVCSKLAAGARALVVVGSEPAAELRERLRDRGVRWRLFEPYDERELRFVAGIAMATDHDGERRKSVRIPTDISTTVFMGRHRKDVVVYDLSAGGAYLATPHPYQEGSRLSVEIPLPNGMVVRGRAQVMSARTEEAATRSHLPEGMGIAFAGLAPDAEAAIQYFVEEWIARFQL
jgi:PilZ domain